MDEQTAKALRAPFPPERIGKLPRVSCGNCRDARSRVCDQHTKSRCAECGSYITSAHFHLDFVGHPDVTDRLLEVDPEWTWEPFAVDDRGLPAFDENGGMWIRLTIAGVSRYGYGDADGKHGGNAVKETIGDAIRNAAMRFGVALDLWRKGEPVDEVNTGPRRQAPVPAGPNLSYNELLKRVRETRSKGALEGLGNYAQRSCDAGRLTQQEFDSLAVEARKKTEELDKLHD